MRSLVEPLGSSRRMRRRKSHNNQPPRRKKNRRGFMLRGGRFDLANKLPHWGVNAALHVPSGRLKCHSLCGCRESSSFAIKQSLDVCCRGTDVKTTHPPSRGNTSEGFPPLASKQTFFFFFFWPIKTYCAGCCFPSLLCFVLFLFFFPARKISINPDEAVGEYAIGFISQAART